jgi:hypothetical protein
MSRHLAAAAACLFALSGAACASFPGAGPNANDTLKTINAHIETCERHYQGGLGVGAAFTFRIDCPAQTPAVTPLKDLGKTGDLSDQPAAALPPLT